ncbi:DUF86 domain-containing protein [Paenibacillus sp. BSR1-1]|uniref:DUF86 domain-containing protein n=1 Tax=Paenibacillus sp. BSR1-1 TaxID=3020845 RepID=UPI0025AEFBC8|nr:DUF86 domain-containing protein [Paenibacillus sp. BSR1-1]MDN3019805.1 DUF86 domain-containing protein [Paenibacillus sp. BSR1-1]
MYFVDRDKMETTLVYLEKQINLFTAQPEWSTPLEKAALERITQMSLEAIFDVGNAMIDGFIMRDPGSYDDIIEILMDEKVISQETGNDLKSLIPYRKQLVQDYTEIVHSELKEQFANSHPALSLFAKNVRDYLTNELGPVSAFKSQE